jgi:hypothetical protein
MNISVPIVVCLIGTPLLIYLIWCDLRQRKDLVMVEGLLTTPIHKVQESAMVAVEGRICCDTEPLISPLSRLPCVSYDLSIVRRQKVIYQKQDGVEHYVFGRTGTIKDYL